MILTADCENSGILEAFPLGIVKTGERVYRPARFGSPTIELGAISDIIGTVDRERIRRSLFYLSSDPLPCRTLNYTASGRDRCTLYEADDFILGSLTAGSYQVEIETVPVQAFVADHEFAWGFRRPLPDEPWYEAQNIFALKRGATIQSELVVVLAHKDSQSWLNCGPGAYDNAVGVAALLEMSRLLAPVQLKRSLMFLFCNEEHWPWTSVQAARSLSESHFDPIAILNIDSIGGKSASDLGQGRFPLVVRFSTSEGEALADLISDVNLQYRIDLEVSKAHSTPNDDDGSFVDAGIHPSVLMIGSYPYADPNYHAVTDTPDKVDIENVVRATKLALATVLTVCELDEGAVSKVRKSSRPR